MKQTLCWTCAHAGKCKKPILGWDAKLHYIKYDKHYAYHVDACPEYEYDGECRYCFYNPKQIPKCMYETCPHHKKTWVGKCAQENFYKLIGERLDG